jgi:hypothetical protein
MRLDVPEPALRADLLEWIANWPLRLFLASRRSVYGEGAHRLHEGRVEKPRLRPPAQPIVHFGITVTATDPRWRQSDSGVAAVRLGFGLRRHQGSTRLIVQVCVNRLLSWCHRSRSAKGRFAFLPLVMDSFGFDSRCVLRFRKFWPETDFSE